MNRTTALIVEDEKATQKYLEHFMASHFPQVVMLGVADGVSEAIDAITLQQPDMIFMDVEIKRGDCFDVLDAVGELRSELIFITAFNEFAVNAFKARAFDYLLKPLEDAQLTQSVGRCLERINQKKISGHMAGLQKIIQQSDLTLRHFSIHTTEGVEFVPLGKLLYVQAKGNYTQLYLQDGSKQLLSRQLKEVADELPVHSFLRIHNSYIINMIHVKKYIKGRGGSILMTNDVALPVSETRKQELLLKLGAV